MLFLALIFPNEKKRKIINISQSTRTIYLVIPSAYITPLKEDDQLFTFKKKKVTYIFIFLQCSP